MTEIGSPQNKVTFRERNGTCALVLGSGGPLAAAWETGSIADLTEEGVIALTSSDYHGKRMKREREENNYHQLKIVSFSQSACGTALIPNAPVLSTKGSVVREWRRSRN